MMVVCRRVIYDKFDFAYRYARGKAQSTSTTVGTMLTPKVSGPPPDIVRGRAASSVSVTETYLGGLAKTLNDDL